MSILHKLNPIVVVASLRAPLRLYSKYLTSLTTSHHCFPFHPSPLLLAIASRVLVSALITIPRQLSARRENAPLLLALEAVLPAWQSAHRAAYTSISYRCLRSLMQSSE